MDIEEKDKKNELIVNFTKENFADMILNFLGKKEKLTYKTKDGGSFEIGIHDLEQFYYLLEQKIEREKSLLIEAFSIELVYDDDSSRTINGIKNLQQFIETRNVEPIALSLSWNVILSFDNTKQVETQEISVVFKAYDDEYIGVLIEHTNNIWGMEVLNLFENQIKSIIKPETKTVKYAKKISSIIKHPSFINIFSLPVVLMTLILFLFINDGYLDDKNKIAAINEIVKSQSDEKNRSIIESSLSIYMIAKNYNDIKIIDNFETPSTKKFMSDYIEKTIKEKDKKTSTIVKILTSSLVIYFTILLYSKYYINYYKTKSFIRLTKKADNEYRTFKENKNQKVFFSISFVAFTLFAGVIINFIYEFIK